MRERRFVHNSIKASTPITGEAALGWSAHYIIGILFAVGLISAVGFSPSLMACLLEGILTSAAPFLIMQPAFGAGIAASKTPRPGIARMNTLITHLSFGVGLYLGVRILAVSPAEWSINTIV
jgi:hypothetical protein